MKDFHLYLVSDSTGETLNAVAKAVLVQFEELRPQEHLYALVRTKRQLDEVLNDIIERPGVVMFTLVHDELRDRLMETCRHLDVPCLPVLDPLIAALSSYFGAKSSGRPGRQHMMDAHYFSRIDAMSFTMAHDDGQLTEDLPHADIILLGVSRTSKTPTCIYLANRGLKTANIPLVPQCPLPAVLEGLKKPLIIGLTTSAERLVHIRLNRLRSLNQSPTTDYVDIESVRGEIANARRLFARHEWPVIDVTRRSIEETAAAVLNYYERRKKNLPQRKVSRPVK